MSSPIIMGRKTRARLQNDELDVIPATPEKGPKRRSILKREQRERENMEKEEKAKEKKEKEEKQEKEKEKGAKKLNFDTEHGARSTIKTTNKSSNNKIDEELDRIFGPSYEIEFGSQSLLAEEKQWQAIRKERSNDKEKSADQMKYLRFKSSYQEELFSVK